MLGKGTRCGYVSNETWRKQADLSNRWAADIHHPKHTLVERVIERVRETETERERERERQRDRQTERALPSIGSSMTLQMSKRI